MEFDSSLKRLRDHIPNLLETLNIEEKVDIASWIRILDGKLLPRLSPDFPLMVAVCGGGSSGKSTLFNSLIGERLSPSGGKAGINRRILVSAPGELFRNKEFVSTLFEPLGAASKPLENKEELTTPGCPLYVLNSNVPRNMVLMDTPDFDTGAAGEYTNRDIVAQALESSDILIYIFTNSNYHNRDNTDFISKVLTGIGMRKCYLIYRVYSGLDDENVMEHAMTVGRNLYRENAENHILGIYRTDEDNSVAAGERFMQIRAIRPDDPPFMESLKMLDPGKLRPELMMSMIEDAYTRASEAIAASETALDGLRLYLDALKAAQDEAVQKALRHFPMDLILKRFADIWLSKDPSHIKFMRNTGKIVGMPARVVAGTFRKVSNALSEKIERHEKSFRELVEEDLLDAANTMRLKTTGPEISVSLPSASPVASGMYHLCEKINSDSFSHGEEGIRPYVGPSDDKGDINFRVPAPSMIAGERKKLENKDWRSTIELILEQKDSIVKLTENIEKDLDNLAEEFRRRMKMPDKLRETFSAFLNVIPATAAVSYILSTGDPVGGAGIKVKLTGLLGLNDLYALIAIPAASGISKSDHKQIEEMLTPIAKSWLDEKLAVVNNLFEKEITGDIMESASDKISDAQQMIREIESIIDAYRPEQLDVF